MNTTEFELINNNTTKFFETIRRWATDAQYDLDYRHNYTDIESFADDISEDVLDNTYIDLGNGTSVAFCDHANSDQIAEWGVALTEVLAKQIKDQLKQNDVID